MRGMYIIRLERSSLDGQPVVMWLTTALPQRWGERENARRLPSKGEARIAAHTVRIRGTWSIEEVEI
jgi:hypothetical protein